MNDFKVVDLLYKGDVSDIWQGIHVQTNTDVHVVTVNKKVNGQIFDQRRMIELEPLVSQLNHPNMLKYHKIVQNENTIGIIMEHPKGSCLRDYLLRRPEKKLSENEARIFFKQITSAVEYVNKHGVVYRNLNLRNIFIDKNNQIKLGDFLICTKVGPMYKPSSTTSSYHFYAPEIWLEDGKKIDPAADVWSLGVLLYVMTCGCYPFDGKHEFDIFLSVRRGQFAIPSSLSDECASLIKAILHPDSSKRLTISGIKNHPWYVCAPIPSNISLKSRLLNGRPLRGIPEEEENGAVNSPILVTHQLAAMKIDNTNQPLKPNNIFEFGGYGDSFIPVQPNMQNQIDEDRLQEEQPKPVNRKKRPSAGEDVQKFIASYFKHKQEDNQQNISSFITNTLNPHTLTRSPSFGPPEDDTTVVLPASKRRSSDSILQSNEVLKLLGLGPNLEEQHPPNPFAPTPFNSEPHHTRSNSSGGEIKTKSKVGASPAQKARTRRRRSSTESHSTLLSSQMANSLQDYNHIFSHGLFLPQTTLPEQKPTGFSVSDLSHQYLQNNQHYLTLQAKQREEKQIEQQGIQKLFDVSLDSTFESWDNQPAFLDPELQRQIENLHTEDILFLDPVVDEWLNSTITVSQFEETSNLRLFFQKPSDNNNT